MSSRERSKRQGEVVSMRGILDWINGLLKLQLTCIEELGSGAVYCRIFQMIHPGSIPIQKVNWQAKNEHQFTFNLKLLQDAFAKLKISRPLEPLKLAKAKCPDNFELAVWFKKHYEEHIEGTHCATNSSLSSKPDFSFAQRKIVPKHFNRLVSREEDVLCECCKPTEKEEELMEGISVVSVKLQMIKEILLSGQDASSKLSMIGQVISMDYGVRRMS